MRKTKIICTLGPATDKSEEIIRELMLSGMDVARFNFSHQTHEEHKQRFDTVVRLREELNLPIATLLDTKGPEVRLKTFQNGKIQLHAGDKFTLTAREVEGDETIVSVSFKDLPKDVEKGNKILIDDGLIELRVDEVDGEDIHCTVINGGPVSNTKGVNVPGVSLSMPYISKKDEQDIIFGIETGFDFIAASFTRSADDIMQIKNILNHHNCHDIRIIAKIENAEGVMNIDDILRVADGIMVARGDMGVEIPYEQIPSLQKMLIKKGYNAGKQVITATQMLDSMMKNPRPTRAETTDVANAIYDGTSAIMLSGETAAGAYPVESLQAMVRIATRTEEDIDYQKRFNMRGVNEAPNVTNAISHATVTTAHDMGAAAIITVTKTGQTARMISKFRPLCPIIGCSDDPKVRRQLNLSWGVIPVAVEEKTNTDELFAHSVECAIRDKLLENGDLVVITAGIPLGISGTTNMLKVHIVGDILVAGTGVTSGVVCGNLCVCDSEEEVARNFRNGDILVVPSTSNGILRQLKHAKGIITEIDGLQSHAAVVGLALDVPVIVGARNCTRLLKSGWTVMLDANRGIVCSATNKG